jgi:mono/diheme cytochrome c family protein
LIELRPISPFLWIATAITVFAFAPLAIGSAADIAAPTFTKEVAPILFKHCASCHRPNEIASAASFLSYDTTRPWTQKIKEKVVQREMPPWTADPNRSVKFRNDPRLSQQDIDTLVAWVSAGAPKGNDADLPPVPAFSEGWLHPKGLAPDVVISLPEFQVPATGDIPYVKYLAKVPFPDDKWVVAMQLRPGNRAVVHHMAITELALADGVTPADVERVALVARKLGLRSGAIATQPAVVAPTNSALHDMLGVYTPGTTLEMYGEGSAKRLRGGKNFYLNFNIHYQTTGKPEKDRSLLGFWFQPSAPKHQLFRVPASGETIIADGRQLLTDAPGTKAEGAVVAIPPIPAYAENYELISITAYTEAVTIYQLQPHAHLRGKDFQYAVIYPDGREETLLTVPKYDFHWQLAYELETPLMLPAGSKLVVTAHYDNSRKNQNLLHHGGHDSSHSAHIPGPEKEVHFREENQSWDEMFTPFVQYSIDNHDLGKPTKVAERQPGQREGSNAVQVEDPREKITLDIAEVVGCLEQRPSTWMLTSGSDPIASKTQTTSSAEQKAAAVKLLGTQKYELLGISFFNPSSHKGHKVAVKGVFIEDANGRRLNVTSLQTVAPTCF